MNWRKQSKQGLILLEIVIVIGILGILFTLLMPSYVQCLQSTREQICKKNCWNLEILYEAELVMQNVQHSETRFKAFLMEQSGACCPNEGTVNYVNGSVICTIHDDGTQEEGNDKDTGIPIL